MRLEKQMSWASVWRAVWPAGVVGSCTAWFFDDLWAKMIPWLHELIQSNVMTCRYVRSSTCGAHPVVLCNFRLVQSRRQTLIKPTFHLSKLQKLCANWRTYGIGGSSCKLCHSKCFRSCIFVQGHLLLGVWSLNDEEAAMLYELQPKFRLMESSIRDIFIFWKLSWGLENDNTLFKKR